jgi:hypothetical protein
MKFSRGMATPTVMVLQTSQRAAIAGYVPSGATQWSNAAHGIATNLKPKVRRICRDCNPARYLPMSTSPSPVLWRRLLGRILPVVEESTPFEWCGARRLPTEWCNPPHYLKMRCL